MRENPDALVTLARFPTESEALLIVRCLEDQGIAAEVAGSLTSGSPAEAPGDVSVLVKHGDVAHAVDALAALRAGLAASQAADDEEGGAIHRAELSGNEDVAFACEDCGAIITFPRERCGHVEECHHCGGYVDVPREGEVGLPAEFHAAASREPREDVEKAVRGIPVPGEQTRAGLWFEVAAVLCLAYVPAMFDAVTFPEDTPASSFVYHELWLIIRTLEVSVPLLLIVALSKSPWSQFGIVRPKWIADPLLGCAIWGLGIVGCQFALSFLPSSQGDSVHFVFPNPEGAPQYVLLLFSSVANGFAEEFAMRGFLLVRLEQLLRSTWLAVVVTSVLFGSYHLYQGVHAAVGIAAVGLVYAISFCLFRRLWPVCIAHALADSIFHL